MNDKTALATTPQAHLLPAGADPNIDAQAIEDRLANRSANTTRAYTQAINEFNHWRQDAKITDGLIREYLHHLSARVPEQTGKPLSVATIRAKVTAIKSDLKAFGLSHVFGPKSDAALSRIIRERSQANTGRGQVTGIQHDPMVEIVVRCEIEDSMAGWRDAALIRTMFDGMLRISEACAAEVEHIEFATGGKHKGTATLEIPRSKTDQTGTEKATVYLSRATVKAIKQYMAFANITGGPLFRGFTSRHKNRVNAWGISTVAARTAIKARAKAAGIDGYISGHSLRVGTAQTLAEKGASLVEMQNTGRWKSSDMPAHYSRGQAAQKNAVAKYIYGK